MSRVTFKVIGCSDAFSSGASGNTCFYIKTAGSGVLIDCGATALYGLKRNRISTQDIDIIILTHFHGDHFAGLPFIVLDAAKNKRSKKLCIISPKGGKQMLDKTLDLFYPGTAVTKNLDLQFLEFDGEQEINVDKIQLTSFPVKHTKQTLPHGVKITVDGITIAYTGDTEWTDTIKNIVKNADLAICECTFFDKHFKGHLDYITLKTHLHELQYKRLLLTHFDEEMLQHKDEVTIEYAYDGLQIELG